MLHALLLVLFTAVARRLGFRDLTPEEEAELPGYFVKAERIQRWVRGIVVTIFVTIIITFWMLDKLGY
jgi:hypothetical protein